MALSAGAVQHPASGELYAVLADGARLCSWKRSHKRMLDGASASFSAKERVGSVLVSAAVPGAVLVHADASVSVVSEQLKPTCATWRLAAGGEGRSRAKKGGAQATVVASVLAARSGTSATMLLFTRCAGTAGATCVALDVSASAIRAGRTHHFEAPRQQSELLGAVHLGEIGRIALLWSCLTLEVRDWLDSDSCSAQVRVSRNFRGDPSLAVSLNPSLPSTLHSWRFGLSCGLACSAGECGAYCCRCGTVGRCGCGLVRR